MSTALRRKRGNSAIWAGLVLVMLGLGGYGVTNFGRGVGEIGQVGNRTISVNEYARAMRSEMAALSSQLGQQVGFPQAQQMGVDRAVQAQLVAAAALENEAARLGLSVGDGQVRERIMSAKALQGPDGKFSRDNYKMFLQQQGLSEAEFERQIRNEAARVILQGAVVGGVGAPATLADRLTAWATEKRDFTFAELIASDLAEPVPAPTDADLKAWHDAHQDAYMRPETRKITYVWLSPDDLVDQVPIDDAALKAAYDQRKAEFVIPEKRLVARLVYPTAADAAAAKARLDKGEASFEQLVQERGLTVADVDLGEVAREDLGPAADAVFALAGPGVVGPVETDLGPALFAMNGILAAQETTFDEARADIRAELALDGARRMIAEKQNGIEDLLAGGGTLEDVAKEAGMKIEQIDYNSESEGGITGYEAFRKTADSITAESFPELAGLDDGGVFALRLDGTEPAALKPLDEVKDKVAADWTAAETHRRLTDLAAERVAELQNGATLETLGLVTTHYDGFGRNDFVSDAAPKVGEAVFSMAAGESQVVDADGKVYLLTLNAVTPADPGGEDFKVQRAQAATAIGQSVGRDVFEMFTRALQADAGIRLDSAAINAVNAQLR